MTTIITKNGVGEPAPGDLSVSEIALDKNTGDLYTKLTNNQVKKLNEAESYDDTQLKADLDAETQARIDGDADLQGQIDNIDVAMDEPASDGKPYSRTVAGGATEGTWVEAPTTEDITYLDDRIDSIEGSISGGGGFVEAPNDGSVYARDGQAPAWVKTHDADYIDAIDTGYKNADLALQGQIDALEAYNDTGIKDDLATETQARIDGDAALQTQINDLEPYDDTQITADLATETQARVDGDAALQGQIDSLEAYDDTQLQADLAAETQARIDGDAALQTQITNHDHDEYLTDAQGSIDKDGKQYSRQDGAWTEVEATGGSSLWEQNGDDIYYNDGNVGIGTTPSQQGSTKTLHIQDASGATLKLEDGTDEFDIQNAGGAGFLVTRSANPIAFYTDSLPRMHIDAVGNVGIGTDLPSEALEVRTGSISILRAGPESPDSHELKFKVDGYEQASINVENSYNMRFLTNNAERMRIDAVGDFLVGSGSKTYTVGSGTYEIDIAGGLNLSSGRDNGAGMTFEVSNSEMMRIDAAGRVGIGGEPSRSTKEIEDEAVTTIANWKSQIDDRLKAEPKADKKAVTLEITGEDKLPTKAELIKRLTERNIGGGNALLQVAGDGYFKGQLLASQPDALAGAFAAGASAGATGQGAQSVAVGSTAGQTSQSDYSVAVGHAAGSANQGSFSVALGYTAGQNSQGSNCVAIGSGAGVNGQGANGIIINSSGIPIDATDANHIYVRSPTGYLYYNGTDTWEFTGGTVEAYNFAAVSGNVERPTHSGIHFSTDYWVPIDSTGALSDGKVDLGNGSLQFKDGHFSGAVYVNGTALTRNSDLIETLSTLRAATQDETTLEGLRDSIGNAIGGLIEKFEAMQSEAGTMDLVGE